MGKGIHKLGANGRGVGGVGVCGGVGGGGSEENSRIWAHEKGERRSPHQAHSLMAFQSFEVGGRKSCFGEGLLL